MKEKETVLSFWLQGGFWAKTSLVLVKKLALCFFPCPAQPHFAVACFSSLLIEKSPD